MKKIITILGARPQFIKAAPIGNEISKRKNIDHVIVHTGQHFDENMSKIFFEEMQIQKPMYELNINSLSHGAMTGKMLEKIEKVLIKEKPDIVLVFGDTNSTLAGALAAKKLHIKVAHIEAGLRSFNNLMPEEINRILTDRISDFLFCPTNKSVLNLSEEGFDKFDCNIIKSGDVMLDAALYYTKYAKKPKDEIPDEFVLATLHREENTDYLKNLESILNAILKISEDVPIVLPLHPRTRKVLYNNNFINKCSSLFIIDPVSYLEILYLLTRCKAVITDSGGLQKEAYFSKKPCITIRNETEWIELVENEFNIICGSEENKIIEGFNEIINKNLDFNVELYGSGNASKIIIDILANEQ